MKINIGDVVKNKRNGSAFEISDVQPEPKYNAVTLVCRRISWDKKRKFWFTWGRERFIYIANQEFEYKDKDYGWINLGKFREWEPPRR